MKKIVFVSRLDNDCSLGAFSLCKIAPLLAKKYSDLTIIIVGGGAQYTRLRGKAAKINEIINRRLIITTGNVSNPSIYFDKSTLFVGVSRAALEAMAHGLPVILFGNEGQLGLLDKSNLEIAKETNFTCRGNALRDDFAGVSRFLFNEICRYYDLSEAKREDLRAFSYQIIQNGYSSQNMAQKTHEVYQKTIERYRKNHFLTATKSPKITFCGYYGRGNLGDEAILSVICEKLREKIPNAHIFVIKNKNPINIVRVLRGADLFIFGGGSLLQNTTSNASLIYYLFIIRMANLLCKRKIMLANGIGPIETNAITKNILLKGTACVLDTFDFISVRDSKSQNFISSILPNRKIHLIPDPAILYAQNNINKWKKSATKKYFLFIPCSNGLKNGKISISRLANTLLEIAKGQGASPIITVLNPKDDIYIARKLKSLIPNAKILCPATPDTLFKWVLNAKFVISQRYHGSLFASMCGVPTFCVSNDPKMNALCSDFSLYPCQNINILSSTEKINLKLSSLQRDFSADNLAKAEILEQKTTLLKNWLDKLFRNL